jgi:hypothetical protein
MMKKLFVCGVLFSAASLAAYSQSRDVSVARGPAAAVFYEGARLILGDGRPPIEAGALVVQGGRITALGGQGAVRAPAGAARVDLIGKTIIPALINVHVHIGYEGYTSWGAENYTPQNVLDHLRREAFYGVGATQSVGSSPTAQALAFQEKQQAGAFPPASRFLFMPGMAPPHGGPDAILIKATTALHAFNEVSTAQEARAAVQAMAKRNIKSVKIWVDDRRGTYPKMTPEIYNAVIDEAHRHHMLVHAHATTLADQKAVVRAGVDVLVHIVGAERVDDEFLALLKERSPSGRRCMGFGDRSEVCEGDPFVTQTYPASHADPHPGGELWTETGRGGNARRNAGRQLPEDDCCRCSSGPRNRRRHRRASHVWLGRPP